MTNIQDEFISTVSHELRTPLTSIRGFSQTLLNSWDKISDDDKKKFIGIISEQSSRLINLVENILSVSKMNSEKQILKQVDINSHVLKIISLLKEQYKNHTFVTHLYEKLPISRLDEGKLQQILTNLIENAAKYSEHNTDIIITTKVEAESIIISVQDHGVGIDSQDYDKIFKKFSRLENHLTSKTQGNGLGLYITQQLVMSMDGEISFTSEVNKGTTFYVKFPIYNQEEALKCTQQS